MLALNVSIPCQSRGLPSCEVATWNLLRKSCNQRACHRVVPATGRWEVGSSTTSFCGLLDVAGFVFRRLPSCASCYSCVYEPLVPP